jgi:hypothetical protein
METGMDGRLLAALRAWFRQESVSFSAEIEHWPPVGDPWLV